MGAILSAFLPGAPTGLQFLTGGGTLTTTTITSAQTAGYTGIFLDPRFVWNMGGVVFNGVQDFLIESRMVGSIGWTGNIAYNTNGYIATGAGQDGVQIYASTPSGATATQGVIFKNCVLVGSNTRAVVHFGGGQRRCGLVDTLVYNTNSSAGAWAVVNGSALSDNNSEDNIFSFTGGGGLAGAYGALGIGVADQTQRSNDTWYYDLVTNGGTYSIEKDNGGNHTFVGHYDRSNPTTAVIYNHGGGRLTFIGGEDQNTSGPSHLLDNASTYTSLINRVITAAGTNGGTTVSISAGIFAMRGPCTLNNAQTFVTTGTPTLDLSDPVLSLGNATITGTASTVVVANNYTPNAGPVLSSFTGTTQYPSYPAVVQSSNSATISTPTTLTFSPGTTATRFRVSLGIRLTGGTVNTALSYSEQNSVAVTTPMPMWQMTSSAAGSSPTYTLTTAASYQGTWADRTSTAGSAITMTITPTQTSNYQYSYELERLS